MNERMYVYAVCVPVECQGACNCNAKVYSGTYSTLSPLMDKEFGHAHPRSPISQSAIIAGTGDRQPTYVLYL